MTMLDQITTGVYNAIQNATNGTALAVLDDHDADALIAQVIAALSHTPEGTPEPTPAVVPAATPVLMISPADVVAMAARNAFTESSRTDTLAESVVIDETWAAGEDYREYREYLFNIQRLFGVRVRSITRDGNSFFLVAGTRAQVSAFQQTAMLIHGLAQPVVSTFLDADNRRELWATLGHLANGIDEADTLAEDNSAAFDAATAYLNAAHGRVRNLTRSEPRLSGVVYDRAVAVMNTVEARS